MLTVIGYLLTAALAAMIAPFVFGGLTILWLFICFKRKSRYNETLQMTATQHICPSCNSTNVKVQPLVSSAITAAAGYGYFGAARSNIQSVKIAICQDCGTDFYYYTIPDIKMIQAAAYKRYERAQITTVIFAIITAAIVAGLLLD